MIPDQASLLIFGATGDLARRMLYPSLYHLHRDGRLLDTVRLIGAARSNLSQDAFREHIAGSLEEFVRDEYRDDDAVQKFLARLTYVPVDITNADDFDRLAKKLGPDRGDLIAYLSTNPKFYGQICANLQRANLVDDRARVVMEKPIGHDLKTCIAINEAVSAVFREQAVFRIDHYLGKETVQNLLAIRFANTLFEPLWRTGGIDHVQITVAEQVGVEGRWSYYDEAGAMRDMVQNHMLQLLCLVAMEPPSNLDPDAVRNEKVKVLRSLRPIRGNEVADKTVRGQYTAGSIAGKPVPGYLEEDGANTTSKNETFVAIKAEVDNWRWKGVPFYLRTGKRLPYRHSEIFIRFRDVPHSIFSADGQDNLIANTMVIRLQPEEFIRLTITNKVPGLGDDGQMRLRGLPLDLSLAEEFKSLRRRIAYERLLLDALANNSTLFVRRDETEEAWAWVDGIIQGWEQTGESPKPYPAGTWGPAKAIAMTEKAGHSWHE